MVGMRSTPPHAPATYADLALKAKKPESAAAAARRAAGTPRGERILGLDLGLEWTGWSLLVTSKSGEPSGQYGATRYAGKDKQEFNKGGYRLAWWMAEVERLVQPPPSFDSQSR